MMAPSLDQMTPDPLPRPLGPAVIRTVERRSCSAISPNPVIFILLASRFALADGDAGFLDRATANELQRQRFADGSAVKLSVNIFEARDLLAGERYENVADDQASVVRRSIRLDFENDGGSFRIAVERLPDGVREADRLQSNAEIAVRDVTFLQKRFDHGGHRRRGNRGYSKPAEARAGDADDATVSVDHGAAGGSGLQADVETNVRRERRSGPSVALGSRETDDAECGNRAAGARAPDDERNGAGFQSSGVTEWRRRGSSFGAFENGDIGGWIAAGQSCGNYSAVGQRHV